ncbi:MAG: hypothetical protein R8M45_03795 [Ghiorsea sp.]
MNIGNLKSLLEFVPDSASVFVGLEGTRKQKDRQYLPFQILVTDEPKENIDVDGSNIKWEHIRSVQNKITAVLIS